MPTLKTYDLFISHAWKYGDEYDRLINLLDSAPYFYYRNYSAPEDKPLHNLDGSSVSKSLEIKQAIDRKIAPVNAVIIISGMYANNREWMEYEIETAMRYRKPIIAVIPRGNTLMPAYIQHVSDTIVGWNTSSVVEAIRQYAI